MEKTMLTRFVRFRAFGVTLMLSAVSCAHAQTPAPAPVSIATAVVDSKLDALLTKLHARGETLTDFTADVSLTTTDTQTGEDPKQLVGKVIYQKPAGDNAKLRITFDKQIIGERTFDQKIEYLLEGEWLTDRDYRRRIETRRQVMEPGAKVNLLKLGEGPFPLPIGQRPEDVRQQFDVMLLPDSTDALPHAKLTPKASTALARKFKSIDVWVDPASDMPTRIETTDRNETTLRRTDLTNIKVNGGVSKDAFDLPAIKDAEWTRNDEKFEQ